MQKSILVAMALILSQGLSYSASSDESEEDDVPVRQVRGVTLKEVFRDTQQYQAADLKDRKEYQAASLRAKHEHDALEAEKLRFAKQQEAHRQKEVEALRRQEERKFQAQQAREREEREEKARHHAEIKRQKEEKAQWKHDATKAAEFVVQWSEEKESRLDAFMKKVIFKFNSRAPLLEEEIYELLQREKTILQALKIAENDLRVGTYRHDPKIEDGIRKKLAKGITSLEYEKASIIVRNARENEIDAKKAAAEIARLDKEAAKEIARLEREAVRNEKEAFLIRKGFHIGDGMFEISSQEVEGMTWEYLRQKYGR